MDGDSVAAWRHLEELNRHREAQPVPPEPLWQTCVWILTWFTFATSTALMGDSNWIFLVYAVTTSIFGALYLAQRRREGGRLRRARTPMSTREKQVTGLSALVMIGVIAISVRYETPWPFVAFNVVVAVGMFAQVFWTHREQRPEVA